MKKLALVAAGVLLLVPMSETQAGDCHPLKCVKPCHVPIHFPIPPIRIPVPKIKVYCECPQCSWGASEAWYNSFPTAAPAGYPGVHAVGGAPAPGYVTPYYWYSR